MVIVRCTPQTRLTSTNARPSQAPDQGKRGQQPPPPKKLSPGALPDPSGHRQVFFGGTEKFTGRGRGR